MFLISRKLLVIVLTILQFFAPLVHGHASVPLFNQGLHVPGLELYSIVHNSHDTQIKALSSKADLEGILVLVDLGANGSSTKIVDHSENDNCIHQSVFSFQSGITRSDINFSTPLQQVKNTAVNSPHSPRAPPVY